LSASTVERAHRKRRPKMKRVVAVLAFGVALLGVFAPAAAADTPAFPAVAPSEGCTDWHLQTWYPMSPDDPQWTFGCEVTGDEYGIAWWRYDEYYWNADSSQVMWFATTFWEDGWYTYCNLYPSGIGACDA
jgi:hypothetical protein